MGQEYVRPPKWRLIDQPLAAQFLVAGGVVAIFSMLSLILLLYRVSGQAEASRWLGQTHRTISRLNTLGRDFYRQQTAVQEWVRTGDQRHLASAMERRQLWDEDLKVIKAMSWSTPLQKETLRELDSTYQAWLALTEPLLKSPRSVGARHLMQQTALFKDTFLIIDRMIDAENRFLGVRDRKEKAEVQSTFTTIAAMNVALLVIFGIVLTKLYFSIARPISDLSRGMARYQEGDLKVRVPVSNQSQIGFLEVSFNDMATKIEGMVEHLRKLDELKTEFLSMVSHELRTPLTSIGGYVKLLEAGDAGPVTETQREFLEIVETNVGRLTNLINDILDVEKMESGKVQLIRAPHDIGPIIQECLGTFSILAAQKGLDLRSSIPTDLPAVYGDRARLVQVFMNLLSNAIKYTKTGFVELRVERLGDEIRVDVQDTGIGISAEDQQKLFQKFHRARGGLTSGEGGTGLGLVIVRGLVQAHQGRIVVESKAGIGTTFSVFLPITEHASRETKPAAVAVPEIWPNPIWILDPDAEDALRMKSMIEGAGPLYRGCRLHARVFQSLGDLPQELRSEERPLLLVVDPGPGAESSEEELTLTSAVRRRLQGAAPILVVSRQVDTALAFAEGASALVTKPIGEREFLIAVRDLVGQRGWRVLVADHNTDVRILIKRGLEQLGIQVDDVDRGSQVLQRLEHEHYDLALIDMEFPDVSHVELMKVIRRGSKLKALPVLLMTDDTKNSPSADQLRSWGAQEFVAKAHGIDGIVGAVTHYLEEGRTRGLET